LLAEAGNGSAAADAIAGMPVCCYVSPTRALTADMQRTAAAACGMTIARQSVSMLLLLLLL
jgi:Lhr-like helicase